MNTTAKKTTTKKATKKATKKVIAGSYEAVLKSVEFAKKHPIKFIE